MDKLESRRWLFITSLVLAGAALACTTNPDLAAVPGGPTGKEVILGEVYATNNLFGDSKQGFVCRTDTSTLYCSKKYVKMDFSEWDFEPKPSHRTSTTVSFDNSAPLDWQEISWFGLLEDNTYGGVVITDKQTLNQIKQKGFDLTQVPAIALTCAKSIDASKNLGVRCALSTKAPNQIEGPVARFFKCENNLAQVSLINDVVEKETQERIQFTFQKDFPCK